MFGMDFDPSSKDLYFTINERNKLGNSVPDDTLDAAPRPGLDFGFPRQVLPCRTAAGMPDTADCSEG